MESAEGGDDRVDMGRSSARGGSQARHRRFQFVWCLAVLLAVVVGIQNVGEAEARITLPVIRSFSQMEGSASRPGAKGMTAEHSMELRNHDYQRSLRHNRKLATVADFPLGGNDYDVGLYYTEIGLGTPPQNYYVQVDTGSDLLWVNCKPCADCPTKSTLPIDLRLYDPESSSTSVNITCNSATCNTVKNIASGTGCVDESCYYGFGYGDGSTTMGYLVTDTLTYSTTSTNSSTNASAKVVFGCGLNQTGQSLTSSQEAVDGIMGFGQEMLSVISQLAEDDLTANQFAHCLQGDTGSGGIFVIGDVTESGLVFTSMVPQSSHYNVILQNISVGGVPLNVPTSAFAADDEGDGGTIFDSGTTLALIAEAAYDAFVNQLLKVSNATQVSVRSMPDVPCFEVSGNPSDAFPEATLFFEGASMQLDYTNYLSEYSTRGSDEVWCLAWSTSSSPDLANTTILGDIVLKNKLVVYDNDKKRIGWVDYNCQSSVNVSSGNGTGSEILQPGGMGGGAGSHSEPAQSLRTYHGVLVLICSVVLAYAGTL